VSYRRTADVQQHAKRCQQVVETARITVIQVLRVHVKITSNDSWGRVGDASFNILRVRLENAYSRPRVLPEKGELGPHLTQCGLGQGLPPYQVES